MTPKRYLTGDGGQRVPEKITAALNVMVNGGPPYFELLSRSDEPTVRASLAEAVGYRD